MSEANTPVKILHFSSTYRDVGCGVGKYQEEYLACMAGSSEVENKFFDISPYQTRVMGLGELTNTMRKLQDELKNYDILHIQHEFGLYWGSEFAMLVTAAKAMGKRVVVTMHLSPGNVKETIRPRLRGLGPRSLMAFARQMRHHRVKWRQHIKPLLMADAVIVHNEVTAQCLRDYGIPSDRIFKIPHPVYEISEPPVSHDVDGWLNKKDGDVILCMVGFLHRYKGTTAAIKALNFLPENYKLLLAGSVKGDSDEVSFEDKVTDLIDQHNLKDRVYITGFIEDDNRLNGLIRECDVCVYPYDKVYYANASSGALNLALANDMPVVAYPTESIKEAAAEVPGAIVLCETFAYYELAREVQRLDFDKQRGLARQYAERMAWPKAAQALVGLYKKLV